MMLASLAHTVNSKTSCATQKDPASIGAVGEEGGTTGVLLNGWQSFPVPELKQLEWLTVSKLLTQVRVLLNI